MHAGSVTVLFPPEYECFAALLSWAGYGEVSKAKADPKDRGFRTFGSLSTTARSNSLALGNTSVVHSDFHSALTFLISCLARVCRSRQARAASGRVGEVPEGGVALEQILFACALQATRSPRAA